MKSYLYPLFALLGLLVALPSAQAQSAGTGSVSGRVFNPATAEYIRNAQVRALQTSETTLSESGGFYQLTHLPPGEVVIEMSYVGFQTVRSTVTIVAGQTATLEFTLSPEGRAPGGTADDDIVQLEKFVVSTEREGQAKVIMGQRASMNIGQHVASDVFGDNTEGNIGEFMRNLPGVMLNTSDGEVQNVSLGGLGAEYTSVTIDGVPAVTADATSSSSRAPKFTTLSLNSIDSLEVTRTVSADMDANAPAGTINLRSKRAFENKGQKLITQANFTMSSFGATLDKEVGPHDTSDTHKIRPGGLIQYSNAFNNNFGILINISESNIYSEESRALTNYNRTPTSTDPRPEVPSSYEFRHHSRLNRRFASSLTMDWRATRRLTLSLTGIFNYSRLFANQRNMQFNNYAGSQGGTRDMVKGEDMTRSIYTTYGTTVVVNPRIAARLGQSITITPKFEYRLGDLKLEGLFSYSDALAWYDPMGREDAVRGLASSTAANALYSVQRGPGVVDADYKVTQTDGPDLSNPASFTFPKVYLGDGRRASTKTRTAKLDATYLTRILHPIKWKAGFKLANTKWHYQDTSELYLAKYTGPLTLSDFASTYEWASDINGMEIKTLSGGGIFMPNLFAIGARYKTNPEEFVSDVSATNYYNGHVNYQRNYEEDINAGYIMGTSKIGPFIIQAGVRREDTRSKIREIDAYTPEETEAQGYAVGSDGIATSIDGVEWQFLSRPRVLKKKSYHNYFPSASIKYQITPNLDLVVAGNKTIRRPSYYDSTGIFLVNDTTKRISLPNRDIEPERSQGFAARLSYYFKRIGQLSVAVYQTRVTNMIATTDEMTAEQAGYDETYPGYNPKYAEDYRFTLKNNSGAPVRVRSMEIAYSQTLGFLGPAFRRCNVHINYTRSYADGIKPMLSPYTLSTGFHYTYKKLILWSNVNWSDDFPTSATGYSLRRHRTQVDAGLGWNIGKGFMFGLNARNINDAPHIHMQRVPPNDTVLQDYLRVGATWTCYIKKTF
ncbi:TonB-dependent receptor domain-containing protein [Ereboglobus luteus]|uniref:TonB-dependent receptor n=1 Tax=Ereboglobus luteus TaxID=1796921 RepID=A0A2U8E453_9BACT|nr:TonB-dependent receptor [Ereboglobus luteus]AWI09689.1 hypothetical protein CKA38_10885 [Ereboglobus luteus]